MKFAAVFYVLLIPFRMFQNKKRRATIVRKVDPRELVQYPVHYVQWDNTPMAVVVRHVQKEHTNLIWSKQPVLTVEKVKFLLMTVHPCATYAASVSLDLVKLRANHVQRVGNEVTKM